MTLRTCPGCQAEIAADHPHGLCPACLLKEGMQSTTGSNHETCEVCSATIADDARFCGQCGAPAPAGAPDSEGDPLRKALEAKLKGQYRLGRMLGRGGMGAVYLARDLALEREVAIKVVKAVSDTQQMHDRFRREARTAARLSHPNIVQLHSFGEVEGMPYFVMGYVRGESLADRLRRDGKIPEDEARGILTEIASALDHAHRQGVVHRDIKPDNVLIEDESGRALLTDFGVAKAPGKGETLTRLGSVVGTPHYMSPEQASGRADIDGRSDIYSLGVMAYAMLAGRLPFEGASPADVLTKHLTQAPPPLRSLTAAVSDSTVQAVERCLAKEPGARWPDARSLCLALGATNESELPDELQAIEAHGVAGAAIVACFFLLLLLLEVPPFVWPLQFGVVVSIYVGVIVRVRLAGHSVREAQRAIWREPRWWPFWYPGPLRRAGNVWHRLPASVRHLRWGVPAFALYFALLLVGRFPNLYRHPEAFMLKVVFGMTGMAVVWFTLIIRARIDLKRRGLASRDVERVALSIPPSRVSFWSRPHIAVILEPDTLPANSSQPDSPHNQMQSILRHAATLAGPLRPLGSEAAAAARRLVDAIDRADRQIAELVRNAEPGEEERLAEKIEALAPPDDGEDEYAPLRTLLEKQLELIRSLAARVESEKAKRNRRVEMLRTLALHLASLHARFRETSSDVEELTGSVRALCDEIARQAGIYGEGETASTSEAEAETVERPASGR